MLTHRVKKLVDASSKSLLGVVRMQCARLEVGLDILDASVNPSGTV
jgi:hypothetical protein